MRTTRERRFHRKLNLREKEDLMIRNSFTLLLFASALLTPNLFSAIRLETPEELQAPFYARFAIFSIGGSSYQHIFRDGDWAAIAFYRDPDCVPADFNLVSFTDFTPDPVYGLRVFGCEILVSGFEVWENGPGIDLSPIHSRLSGEDVPVWFVSWSALEAEVADGIITIGELAAMPSLRKGLASHFSETLNPPGPTRNFHLSLEARGMTEDGAEFVFHAAVGGDDPICCTSEQPQQNVTIRFD